MFITDKGHPFNILVECDENSHGGELPSCSMARVQEIHDSIIANRGVVRPLVIVRFNPDSRDQETLENDLKGTLDYLFMPGCPLDVSDARGIVLHKLIGYGTKRKQMYDESKVTKRVKL